MSELMISPAPTPPASAGGNAHPLGSSDPAARPGTGTSPGAEGGTSPFAATLQSKMDKNTAEASSMNSQGAATTEPTAVADAPATPVDLAAIFQFLGADAAGKPSLLTTPATTSEDKSDDKAVPGLEAAVDPLQTQMPVPLPLVSNTALTNPNLPAEKSSATPGSIIDTGRRRQSTDTSDGTFGPGTFAQDSDLERNSGKLMPDAAINADAGTAASEKGAREIPANDFRALMDRANLMTPVPASASNGVSSGQSLRIDTPLGQAGWHDEMGQKLTWMVGNNRQQADLVLNPPQLGRIEVSLTMNGDQATAIFTSANPAVRETLEGSIHRLREVLADAGVSLGQTQVGSESPQQSARRNETGPNANESVRYASAIPLPSVQPVARAGAGRSMIDIFA